MFSSAPLKIYIQDVYRALPTENKYVHELFSNRFKKVSLHGVVTEIKSVIGSTVTFELTDPTASVHVFFNAKSSDRNSEKTKMVSLQNDYDDMLSYGHKNLAILKTLKDKILLNNENVSLQKGCYVNVIGNILSDSNSGVRMVSAFECYVTSVERDIVWLNELKYLYDKFYTWKKSDGCETSRNK